MHIGLHKDFDELTFEAEDAVLETADRKPNGAFTEFQEAHFANKRMTRRHRAAEIHRQVDERRADIAVHIAVEPVIPGVHAPPLVDRLKREIRQTSGIGDPCRIAVRPSHRDDVRENLRLRGAV